ncbi:MAG: Pyrrolo-quinoline quinone [Planctomycetes bacterium]|nr:Pyrrolo-quinoline quinone [Planctomycetota bacterium]
MFPTRSVAATIAFALLGAPACRPREPAAPPAPVPAPPAPAAFAQDDWPAFRGQPGLTGLAGGELAADQAPLWTTRAGGPITSSAVIVGERVYVGSEDGKVLALRLQDGERIWATPLGKPERPPTIEAPPLFAAGRLYVGDHDGVLWCLSAERGEVLWQAATGDKIVGAAAIAGDGDARRVLVGSHDQRLHGFDAQGRTRFTCETDGYVNGTAAVAGDLAVFGGCDGKLRVVRAADGTMVAAHDLGAYIAASPAVAGGRAWIGHHGGQVVCLDVQSGEVLWRYGAGEFPFFGSPAVDGTRVVIGGRDRCVHAIDRATGQGLWTFRTRGLVDSSPVICGGKVVAASEDGRVYVLDLARGERLWSHDVGAKITASPAVARGRIVVGAHDGSIWAFGPRR